MFKCFIKRIKYHKLISKAKSFFKNNDSGESLQKTSDLRVLTKWYSNEILYISNQIDDLESESNIICSCGKECSGCCQQAIFINSVEFEILKYNILKLNRSVKEKIKCKSKNICDVIQKTKVPMRFSQPLTMVEQQSINEQYFDENLMCPLVGENNECLIYHIRPLVCLTYRNYGDRKKCALTYTPELGHAYTCCDAKIRTKMNNSCFSENGNHMLLASALNEILN